MRTTAAKLSRRSCAVACCMAIALAALPLRHALADETPAEPAQTQETEVLSQEGLNLLAANQLQAEAEEEERLHPTGSMPREGTLHRDLVPVDEGLSAQATLPTRYSSLDQGHVTGVKDQGSSGHCWVYATIAASEASLLRDGLAPWSIDLSERHLAYFCNHDGVDPLGNLKGDHSYSIVNWDSDGLSDPYMKGQGNSWRSGFALSSWIGPVNEEIAPSNTLLDLYQQYLYGSLDGESFLSRTALSADLARGRNAYRLKGQLRVPLGEATLKQAVMEHGALTLQVLGPYTSNGYNETAHSFYHTEDRATTHDVTLVGWDDSYARENFAPGIPATGYEGYEQPSGCIPFDLAAPRVETGNADTGWLSFVPDRGGYYELSASATSVDESTSPTWSLGLYAMAQDGLPSMVRGGYLSNYGSAHPTVYLRAGTTYYMRWETLGLGANDRAESIDIGLNYLYDGLPSSDGAWLVKNSWGDAWGDDGLYWISYEDSDVTRVDQANLFIYGTTDGANHLYQYDGTSSLATNSMRSGGSIANVFKAKANPSGAEWVKEVSFWLADDNVSYSVQVYLDVAAGSNPTAGIPALAKPITGRTGYEGYYTVALPGGVSVQEGSRYSVVVTLKHDDGSDVYYNVDATGGTSWVHYVSAVAAGQSFAQDKKGAAWKDLARVKPEGGETGCCARIKVATSNARPSSVKLAVQAKTYTGKAMAYTGKVTKSGSTGAVSYRYYKDAKCTKAVAASAVKNSGLYYVKAVVAAKGDYAGAVSKPVKLIIMPKGTKVATVKAAKNALAVTWKKQAVQSTGYQIQYATNKNFKGAKTVTVAKPKATTRKLVKLKAKTTYFVRVRTYKKVSGKAYFSAWSAAKRDRTM